MDGIFEDEFTDANDVFSSFRVKEEDREGVNILFASYTYEFYNGSATVIFERYGKLYENYGGHCSCYGLEDQWEPEEIDVETYAEQLKRRGDTKILDVFNKYLGG